MTTPDPSRAAFERHMLKIGETGLSTIGMGTIARMANGDYEKAGTQERWLTWQAAMAHMQADFGGGQNSHESLQTRMDTGSTVGPNNGWQSIETAPKDGERILLSGPTGRISVGFYEKSDGSWFWPQGLAEPTHWQPLPAAPKQEGSA